MHICPCCQRCLLHTPASFSIPLKHRTLLPAYPSVCCYTQRILTVSLPCTPRTFPVIEESACHTCITSIAYTPLLSVLLPPCFYKRRAIDRNPASYHPHITGGQTSKKKATASLQSLVSTVHAIIITHLKSLLFTHFLPLKSPLFPPVLYQISFIPCKTCLNLTLYLYLISI